MDPALPVTPPGERVQLILGNDASKQGLSPRPLFSEMEVLLTGNDDSSWKEIARYFLMYFKGMFKIYRVVYLRKIRIWKINRDNL